MSLSENGVEEFSEEWPELIEDDHDVIDLHLLTSLVNDSAELGPENALKNTKYNQLLTPFDLEWVFGFDVNVPVLNLTTETRKEIFYVATNVGVLYDYVAKTMRLLKGHHSKIISASCDKSGKWLATCDNTSDNSILMWDTGNKNLVWTIFNHPQAQYDLLLIALSPNARLLISISNYQTNTMDFWLWTYGNSKPDDSYTDDRNLGAPKTITFHPNKQDHVMIVFEKAVLFFCWNNEQKKLGNVIKPKVPVSVGHYTSGTYVNRCQEAFVSSSKGCILVFGNTIFAKNYIPEELDNDKFYVKAIKITSSPITFLTATDEVIVTGNTNGTIMFLDKRLKLLFWVKKKVFSPIKSISFALVPRKFEFVAFGNEEVFDVLDQGVKEHSDDVILDYSQEYEQLVFGKVPKDASLKREPFIMRDFVISTIDGAINMMSFPKQELTPLFPYADCAVAAIEVHNEMPYILIAYTKGRLVLFNYATHEEIVSTTLPETDSNAVITCITYSNQCLHLACGKSNGEVWLLQPASLAQIYIEPFKFAEESVMKIAFSNDSLQMAYCDTNNTVFVFYYDPETEDWMFKGKLRSHYKEITNLLYLDEPPYSLYTTGKDRYLIKYTNTSANEEELGIFSRDRIEQKDMPMYFITYPTKKFSKGGYFLVSDDKHKFKIINTKTSMCVGVYLAPSYGCFRDSHIVKMEFLPNCDKQYLIFMTKGHIGIQLMPIDGNPFKYVGCLGHPEKLIDFRTSYDGQFLFTIGKNDRTVFQWRVKTTSVETMHLLGGQELQPFYSLIEGGRNGFHFQEMRDLFYYMQILQQGEQISAERQVTNHINLGELPDLMRACGYYPSEYEIENLLTDARYKEYDDTGVLKDRVNFCDFVKLFINHKPAYGYSIEAVEQAFETLTSFSDEYGGGSMPKEDFIEAITTTGEQLSNEHIYRCLATLMHEQVSMETSGEREFTFLPDDIDFDTFADDILGIDMDSIERKESEGYDDDDNDENDGGVYYSYFRH